tara:strand:+ start:5955 stop:6311 length:357 start_codon:yes stop_codon:yes gene_type:complete
MTTPKESRDTKQSFPLEPPVAPRRPKRERKTLKRVIILASMLLLGNALVGERGLIETFRAYSDSEILGREIQDLRRENESLRRTSIQLQENPQTIEELARRDLGLIRPGEILLVIRDN